jgi:hypothetical protein
MADPATVAAVLHRIDVAHQRFEQARLQLTDAQLLAPVLAGGRSGKDLLAHVTFWDQRLLYAIDPADGPDAFRLAPPVIADIPYDEHWADRVNERIWRLRRDQELAAVTRAYVQTFAQLEQVLHGLSPHDILDPDGLSAAIGIPLLPLIEGVYEHYEEHTADLERLRAR